MGAKKSGNWRRRLADILELPREIVLNLPRVTIVGNLQCYIENHRGVIEYAEGCVRVAIESGELAVRGHDLVIRYLASDEIAVEGTVTAVEYKS
ncbi:MAG TPA: sporulation protein YqfC [Firmicutes bacterium]|nr:sporulation protein YqfC [Bacillota bacterium]